jgi:hypothetical protein
MSWGGRLNLQAELLDKPVAYGTGYSACGMFCVESIRLWDPDWPDMAGLDPIGIKMSATTWTPSWRAQPQSGRHAQPQSGRHARTASRSEGRGVVRVQQSARRAHRSRGPACVAIHRLRGMGDDRAGAGVPGEVGSREVPIQADESTRRQ